MDQGTIQYSGTAADAANIPAEALIALGYDAPAESSPEPTPSQDAPAVSEPAPTEPTPPSTTETPAPEAAPAPAEAPPWRAALKDVSDDDLLRDPVLSGRIGTIAQRLAARDRAKAESDVAAWRAAQAQQASQAELDQLRYADPAEYVRRDDALRAETTARVSTYQEVYAPARQLFYALPDADQRELSGKVYPGSPGESVAAYLQDVVNRSTRAAVAQAQTQWEQSARKDLETRVRRELTPAIRKDVLSEQSGEPSPDNAPGAAPVDLPMDPESIRKMSHADYEKNRERYLGLFPTRR